MEIETIAIYSSIISTLALFIGYSQSYIKKMKAEKKQHLIDLEEIGKEIKELISLAKSNGNKIDITVYIQARIAEYRHDEIRIKFTKSLQGIIFFILFLISTPMVLFDNFNTYFSWITIALILFGFYSSYKINYYSKSLESITNEISNNFIDSLKLNIDRLKP